jgi:tRNA (guanine37-N1)-methyltransferase
MHIAIISLFPEFFDSPLRCGLMQRARDAGIVSFSFHNPRDFATDKHRSVDDRPYGGGPGMVMLPGPMAELLRSLGFRPRGEAQPGRLLMLSPGGKVFNQRMAVELASAAMAGGQDDTHEVTPGPRDDCDDAHDHIYSTQMRVQGAQHPAGVRGRAPHSIVDNFQILALICGRYEGLDGRIEELFPVESLCVGDAVLNGGEAAALCVIEAVARLLPGFMGHEGSGDEESFSAGLLEYPHYTRPEMFEGHGVPEPLRSGDHARIALWRRQASLLRTLAFRPDLLEKASLGAADRAYLRRFPVERPGRNLYCALVHYPVLDKDENTVAVSLTNLDIHDIARSSCAYGLGGYYVVTPLQDQREILETILNHWTKGKGKTRNPDRDAALELVHGCADVEEAIAAVRGRSGQEPLVLGSSARVDNGDMPCYSYARVGELLRQQPVLLLLGTGQGLSPQLSSLCGGQVPPLRWQGGYNHLSVRSALAIMLDRILGDWR